MPESRPVDDGSLDQVLAVVLHRVGRRIGRRSVDADADLADQGLDSLAMVAVLVDLEAHWSVEVPAELLDRATFTTARTLAAAFAGLVGSSLPFGADAGGE